MAPGMWSTGFGCVVDPRRSVLQLSVVVRTHQSSQRNMLLHLLDDAFEKFVGVLLLPNLHFCNHVLLIDDRSRCDGTFAALTLLYVIPQLTFHAAAGELSKCAVGGVRSTTEVVCKGSAVR